MPDMKKDEQLPELKKAMTMKPTERIDAARAARADKVRHKSSSPLIEEICVLMVVVTLACFIGACREAGLGFAVWRLFELDQQSRDIFVETLFSSFFALNALLFITWHIFASHFAKSGDNH